MREIAPIRKPRRRKARREARRQAGGNREHPRPNRAGISLRRAKRRPPGLSGPAQPAAVQPSRPSSPPRRPAPPVEAAVAPEERRDANDLARAAIERLRGASDGSPRPQEAARIPDAPRARRVRRKRPASCRRRRSGRCRRRSWSRRRRARLRFDGSSQPKPPYAASAGTDDPRRPTPPADIPLSRRRSICMPRRQSRTARTYHGCRRHAVGGEIGVSRGIAEIIQHGSEAADRSSAET